MCSLDLQSWRWAALGTDFSAEAQWLSSLKLCLMHYTLLAGTPCGTQMTAFHGCLCI